MQILIFFWDNYDNYKSPIVQAILEKINVRKYWLDRV
jgi:hypothetical protein